MRRFAYCQASTSQSLVCQMLMPIAYSWYAIGPSREIGKSHGYGGGVLDSIGLRDNDGIYFRGRNPRSGSIVLTCAEFRAWQVQYAVDVPGLWAMDRQLSSEAQSLGSKLSFRFGFDGNANESVRLTEARMPELPENPSLARVIQSAEKYARSLPPGLSDDEKEAQIMKYIHGFAVDLP